MERRLEELAIDDKPSKNVQNVETEKAGWVSSRWRVHGLCSHQSDRTRQCDRHLQAGSLRED